MRIRIIAFIPVFVLVSMLSAASLKAADKETARVAAAADVVNQIMAIPEKSIPPALLADAQGLAIIPGVIKVGFVVGGQYGRGVLVVRERDGSWSEPVFITLTSGSVGWQLGAESTDFILVFKDRKSIDGIMKGKYTLGADVAVAAGPVGRRAEAATDVKLAAEIYSYSRNRGLFAGVSLEGSALQIDDAADAAFYGRGGIHASEIVDGKGLTTPAVAATLERTLDRYTHPAQKGCGGLRDRRPGGDKRRERRVTMRKRYLAALGVLFFGTIVLPGCFYVGHWWDPDEEGRWERHHREGRGDASSWHQDRRWRDDDSRRDRDD